MHTQIAPLDSSAARSKFISLPMARRLHAAWKEGITQLPSRPEFQRTQAWDEELREHLSERQKTVIKACMFYLGKARSLAAQGDVTESIRLFAVARSYRDDRCLDDEGRHLCVASLEAAEAYLDYIYGDIRIARERILAAMAADEALEEKYGYRHLHIHRIHLANNLVKLEACAGRLEEALALAANLLLYVAGETETVDAPTRWGPAWTEGLSEPSRRFLATQTTREIGCATAGQNGARTLALWMATVGQLNGARSSRAGFVAEWHQLKGSFLACSSRPGASTETFVDLACAYLTAGPRGDLLLWQLAALDTLLLCSELDSTESFAIAQEMNRSLENTSYLPRHVHALLQRCRVSRPYMPHSTDNSLLEPLPNNCQPVAAAHGE